MVENNFRKKFYDAKTTLDQVRLDLVPLASTDPELESAWRFVFSAIESLEDYEVTQLTYDMVLVGIDQCKYAQDCLERYSVSVDNEDQEVMKLKDMVADAIRILEAA